MIPATLTAMILALATVLAWARLRRWPPGHARGGLMLLQPLLAGALYLALFPLPVAGTGSGATLVVAGAGSSEVALAAARGEHRLALPEAPPSLALERVPDLATALRRYPATRRLQLVANALGARDRDAAGSLALDWAAPAPVPGLAWLSTPPLLAPGAGFQATGQVAGITDARLELLDPAQHRIASARADGDGRFVLEASVRDAGQADFQVRVLDAQGRLRDHAILPVTVATPPPLQLQWLAGAPQPELKYLRRWADDAGLASRSTIAVGAGLHLGDGPALDPASLDKLDLLVLDERSLASLGAGQRSALAGAVERGLGVLVRLTAVPDAGQRAALAQLGWSLRGDGHEQALALDPATDAAGPAAADPAMATLQRLALAPLDAGAQPLGQDRDGHAWAWWRAHGRGRIGLSTVLDSYRLVLAGEGGRHGALWSALLSPLARPQPPALRLEPPAWQGERTRLCGLPGDARLSASDGSAVPLLVDATGCAALWPRLAGTYRWQAGTGQGLLPVRSIASAPALHANAQRQATLALRGAADVPAAAVDSTAPGPHWPGWLAFVALAALAWWLERRRPPAPVQAVGNAS